MSVPYFRCDGCHEIVCGVPVRMPGWDKRNLCQDCYQEQRCTRCGTVSSGLIPIDEGEQYCLQCVARSAVVDTSDGVCPVCGVYWACACAAAPT
jgi:hypothetical protein